MDLRITIEDENRDTRLQMSVYQDGSDSEGVDCIEKLISDHFTVEAPEDAPFDGDMTQPLARVRSPESVSDVVQMQVDEAELATILAALRTYQEAGYGDPIMRPSRIDDIASGDHGRGLRGDEISKRGFNEIWSEDPNQPPDALKDFCLAMGGADVLPGRTDPLRIDLTN